MHAHPPDDEANVDFLDGLEDDPDVIDNLRQIHKEHADYNDSWSRSNEEGWFYPDED